MKTAMKEYIVAAKSARPVGSIGVMRMNMSVQVVAESEDDALIKAYEQMQDIVNPTIKLVTKGKDNQ